MNKLFVVNKPTNISSNNYLRQIKRKYNTKKAGYSGTLDPFAKGCLIVAFGQYTKLFRFLKKSPKKYKATLYLGAISETLDIEKIEKIENVEKIENQKIQNVLSSLKGEIQYFPPKYCAKKIDGRKAYELARENKDFELKKIKSIIYDLNLISYEHPFITFNITISEGGYIRSIGAIIAEKLGSIGALKELERINEGDFIYENEKSLNPLQYLNTIENFYLLDKFDILLGKKLQNKSFKIEQDGIYHIVTDNEFAIIEIKNKEVKYLLNKIKLDKTC